MMSEFVEPIVEPLARMTGISSEDVSVPVTGEAAGVVSEIIIDSTTVGWLNVVLHAATGLIATFGSVFARDMPVRTKRELLQWGLHEIGRVPEKIVREGIESITASFQFALNAAKRGDWNTMLATGLRRPVSLPTFVQVPQGTPSTPETPETPIPSGGGASEGRKEVVLVR